MKIDTVKVYRYRLTFRPGLRVRQSTLSTREGFILELINEGGQIGLGEISPLPGCSPEDMRDVDDQVYGLGARLIEQSIPDGVEALDGGFAHWFSGTLAPSVQFGLEMAVLNLFAACENVPLARLLQPNFENEVNLNALLHEDVSDVEQHVQEMLRNGYRSIKLKLGTRELKEDIARALNVQDALQDQALLRIDVNQAWNFDQAVAFIDSVGIRLIEYIEEPFADLDRIPEFYDATSVPVALDETVLTMPFDDIRRIEGVDVLVVKPTLYGGFEKTWQLAQKAQQHGIEVIISSSYETGLGIIALANLAACFSRQSPVGLDTLRSFRENFFVNVPVIEKARISVLQPTPSIDQINFKLLTEIFP